MENSPKELEALQKFVPFAPCTTSYRMGWKGLEAVRYRTDSASVEFTLPRYLIIAYVIARRVERAQQLLRTDGGLGLAEVAFRSGFANQSHFCFQFKRILGITPRQFQTFASIP
jgi:AraC-like DNA-binding protein